MHNRGSKEDNSPGRGEQGAGPIGPTTHSEARRRCALKLRLDIIGMVFMVMVIVLAVIVIPSGTPAAGLTDQGAVDIAMTTTDVAPGVVAPTARPWL